MYLPYGIKRYIITAIDYGSRFAKYFLKACRRLKITDIYTKVRTPKDNSINERFNRTLKEEFIETDEAFEVYLASNKLKKTNERLTEYLIFYNLKRPHQALDYKTPIEYYNENYKLMRVLAKCPTYTD